MKINRVPLYGGLSALVVLLAVIGYYLAAGRGGVIGSIAVLPLKNLSGNPDHEYYTDGVTETLINELSRIGALRVISYTSVMHYKYSDTPLKSIARELKVDAVVKGSLQHAGDRIRIAIQLIRSKPQRRIWENVYECNPGDVLNMQEEMARDVSREIKVSVTQQEEARPTAAKSGDPAAQESYLKGRSFINTWTKESIETAIEHFERTLELEPHSAPAHAALAQSYDLLASFDWIAPHIGFPKARTEAHKALKLDETLAEAHTVMGDVKFMYDWDWKSAERDFKRAIELLPGSATAHVFYAGYLLSNERYDEAFDEILFAQEYDPHSYPIKHQALIFYVFSRQHDRVITQAREILKRHPESFEAHYWLGWVYREKAMYEEALEEYQTALSLAKKSTADSLRAIAGLARTHALSGEAEKARTILGDLVEQANNALVTPYIVAKVFAILGETDRAFEWLERAYLDRSPYMVLVKVDSELDNLRTDPRFDELLRRMGLE